MAGSPAIGKHKRIAFECHLRNQIRRSIVHALHSPESIRHSHSDLGRARGASPNPGRTASHILVKMPALSVSDV